MWYTGIAVPRMRQIDEQVVVLIHEAFLLKERAREFVRRVAPRVQWTRGYLPVQNRSNGDAGLYVLAHDPAQTPTILPQHSLEVAVLSHEHLPPRALAGNGFCFKERPATLADYSGFLRMAAS